LVASCGGGSSSAPTDLAPHVELVQPGSVQIETGQQLTLEAIASDADGSVELVEFLAGSDTLGAVSSAPYRWTWTATMAGDYQLTARAIDDRGAVAVSNSVTISVRDAAPPTQPNQPPQVRMTAPQSGFKPAAPGTVVLQASASDVDGSVASVEFFVIDPAAPVFDDVTRLGAGAFDIGSGTWHLTLTELAAGRYAYAARARDDKGATGTSGSVLMIVNATPAVSIVAPRDGQTVRVGSSAVLEASANDADGAVALVEFKAGAEAWQAATLDPGIGRWRLSWVNTAQVGAVTVLARATDNDGAVAQSASLVLNGVANSPPSVSIVAPPGGQTAKVGTSVVLEASANDADGSVTVVEFKAGVEAWQAATYDSGTGRWRLTWVNTAQAGAVTVLARATDNDGAVTQSAALVLNGVSNSPPSVSIVAPPGGQTVKVGSSVVLEASANDADGSVTVVEFKAGAEAWQAATLDPGIGRWRLTWVNTAQVGAVSVLARANDNDGAVTQSAALVLNGVSNVPPSVTLQPPVLSQPTASLGTTLTLRAQASDADGSLVGGVTFRTGGAVIATVAVPKPGTSVFEHVVANPVAGTYGITAEARDDNGALTSTPSQSITVQANPAPAVTLAAPSSALLGPVRLSASAADADGIVKVEFYAGTAKVGTDTTAPYTFDWTPTSGGTYQLRAVATDGYGTTDSSATKSITVHTSSAAPAGGILVVAPHPDDDIITSAGVSYNARQRGASVKIVFVTNGDAFGGPAQGYARQVEAVAAQVGVLGANENDLMFLGYPNGGLETIYASYPNENDQYVTSFNQSVTYGNRGLGRMDYHRYRFGSSGKYNKFNILKDLKDILLTYKPAHVFTVSEYDRHEDHATTYKLVKDAVAAANSADASVRPAIHKTIVWALPVNAGPYAWPQAASPTTFFTQPPSLPGALPWSSRESLDVPLAMQDTNLLTNLKARAVEAHDSQQGGMDPSSYISRFVHKDEFFWVENTLGANQPPRANAGVDQSARAGTAVQLNGSASVDPEGAALTHQWTQVAGPSVGALSPTALPGFMAPPVATRTVLGFHLVVSDGTFFSAPDLVHVVIDP
jgi:LmbE family N-acetylglucosaminyl deacetylase